MSTAKDKKAKPAKTTDGADLTDQKTGKSKRGGRRSTTWKPGIPSPNPKGRPPGMGWKEMFRQIGDEVIDGRDAIARELGIVSKDRVTWREAVARQAYRIAATGGARHLQEIMDREDGKVAQPLEHNLGSLNEELAKLIAQKVIDANNPLVKRVIKRLSEQG